MSRHVLLRSVLVIAIVAAAFAEVITAPVQAHSDPTSSLAAPTDTPEIIYTDADAAIFNLTMQDNLLYYHSPCGGELEPARSRVRSWTAEGNQLRTLYYPSLCQADRVISSNIAVDNSYVYWLTGDGHVVRLSRSAWVGDVPQLVATMAFTATTRWITVDDTQVYWSEDSTLYRAPKDGSGSRTLVNSYAGHGPGAISQLTADGSGSVYLIYANTVFRDRITLPEVAASTFGLGQGFTLGNNKVYWAEKDASTSTVYIKSAPLATPTSGVSLLTTIASTGNPVVAFLAVDSTNLFWHEARSGAGPLQRMPNTGGGVSSIVLSMPTPRSLNSNGLHVFWNDYGNIYRISAAATAITLDLVGTEQQPEVIQAIQSGTGSVTELVRGKETFVRVYGRIASSSAGLTSITNLRPPAVVRGFRGGVELPGSPLLPINPNNPLRSAATDRTQYDSSYWFRLPTDWVDGTISLTVRINPNYTVPETNFHNNSWLSPLTVTFARKAPICIDLVPVDTTRGTTIAYYDPTRNDRTFFNRARALLPTNELRIFYRGGPLLRRPRWYLTDSDPYTLTPDDSNTLIFWSNVRYLFGDSPGSCSAANAPTVHVTMVTDRPERCGSTSCQLGLQFNNSLEFFTVASLAGQYPANTPGGGTVLAHELGHFFGRWHVDCPSSPPGNPGFPVGSYPYPTCQIDNIGANSNIGYDYLTNQLLLPSTTADVMSYGQNVRPTPKLLWPSDYTWRAIFNGLGTSPTALSAAPQRPTGPSATLLVYGVFSSTGTFVGPAYQISGALETNIINQIVASTQQTTTYEVRVYNGGNSLIGSTPLRIASLSDTPTTTLGFMNWVYYSSATAPTRVDIARVTDNAVVRSITAGANPPTVTITSPIGGSYTTGLTAAWTGGDPDGDTVVYTVRYSPDNGTTWLSLATALGGNQLTIPFNDGLPGGAQALLQVLATDGIHTTVATSAPFSVALHAPQAAIYDANYRLLTSTATVTARQSDTVVLHADSYDAEDGPLSGTAYQWNVTGPLSQSGSGDQLTLFNLPPGTYVVQLTATDSNNQTAVATTSVVVSPKIVYDGAEPTLDGFCTDAGYDTELDPITLRYTDVISVAQVHFAHANGALWACFSGLQIGSRTDSFVGIRADVDNSGGPWATSSDLGFFVGRDGAAFTARGDGVGGFTTDAAPDGLTAAVSEDTADGLWNAELRINQSKLGGWLHLIKAKVSHYWRNYTGDDTVWPTNAYWNVPDTWGLMWLGQYKIYLPLIRR